MIFRPVLLLAASLTAAAPLLAQPPQLTREELAATTVEVTPERDAAAKYMNERSATLYHMGASCRKLLRMPAPSWGQPEANAWDQHHYRYSAAVSRYIGKRQAFNDGLKSYLSARERIEAASVQGEKETAAWLKAAPDRAQACQEFFADSAAGRLNLTPEHVHTPVLEDLARRLFDPRTPAAAASAP